FDLTSNLVQEEIVAEAIPDVLLELGIVTDTGGAAMGWDWDPPSAAGGTGAQGGNWGLEYARVPQMWNGKFALDKRNPPPSVSTAILDDDFLPTHEDLKFVNVLGAAKSANTSHGTHVSGIIGAKYNNGKGIDGVNPFAELTAYQFNDTLID